MNKLFFLVALLPLVACAPNTGSYASFSHHGHSYGYEHDHQKHHVGEEPVYYHTKPSDVEYKPYNEPSYKAYNEPAYKAYNEPAYKAYNEPAYKAYNEPAYKAYTEPAYKAYTEPAYKAYHPTSDYSKPHYGYEKPKHNCTIQEQIEEGEVCTPSFKTVCEKVDQPIKRIVDGEYCYDVARTVCKESIEKIDNQVCSYEYQKKYEDTKAKTVEITFMKKTDVQMVTVCQPGYGHHSYGHEYCKEVAQETVYNVPVVSPKDVDVRVSYPEPIKTCVNKPISLPKISCEIITDKKCVSQPKIETETKSVEKCITELGSPECHKTSLSLPKQSCVELVYGYAEETSEAHKQ